jgi:hypothetical protein
VRPSRAARGTLNEPAPVRATLHTVDDSTQRGPSRETLIADALAAVFTMVDEAESTPRVRELRSQACFYDRAIKHWTLVPPTFAKLDAMFDLIVELHGTTLAAKRTRSA